MTSTNLQVPTNPVARGTTVTTRLRLDADGAALGALRLRITAPADQFADVTVTNLAFTGAGAVFSHSAQAGGATLVVGSRLSSTVGPLDVLDLSLRVIGTPGQGHAVGVEVLEAVATDGRPLRFDPITTRVYVALGDPEILTTALDPARSGVPYHALLRAQGGRSPHAWAVSGGALPSGMTLSASGIISGTSQFVGTASFQVRVVDATTSAPRVDTVTLSLTVREAPLLIVPTILPPSARGHAYTAQLQHTGGRAPIVWQADGLPPGLAISGSRIVGTPTAPLSDYTALQVTLRAHDTSEPPQQASTTVELPRVATLPFATFAVEASGGVAVGRDLVLVEYILEASAGAVKAASDPDFEKTINDVKDSILAEMVGLMGYPDIPERDGDVPLPRPGPDPVGPGNGPPAIPPGEGPGGPEPDDWGPRHPDQDRRDRLVQLLQQYVELDEATESTSKVRADVVIEIDGEGIDAARLTVGGFRRDRATVGIRRQGQAARHKLARRSAGVMGYLTDASVAAALAFAGKPLLGRLRHRLDAALAREREGSRQSVENVSARSAAVPRFGATDDAVKQAEQEAVRRALGDAASAAQTAANQVAFGHRSAGSALAGLGMILGGALLGGPRGAMFMAIPQVLAAGIGAGIIADRMDGFLDHLNDFLVGEELDLPGDNRSRVTLHLTPGAHVVTVRWDGSIVGQKVSVYDAGRNLASTLNYTITLTPSNPEQWPRLDGSTQINGGGSALGGTDEHRVSLFSSDLDIVVATSAGLRLLPGRGDGTFAEPRPFGGSAATAHSKVLVARMDQYGRSSLAAVRGSVIDLELNAGIRAFVHRSVALNEALGDEIRDLSAGDLDGDTWAELVVAFGEQVVVLEGLRGLFADTPTPATVRMLPPSSLVAHDPVTTVLCMLPPANTAPAIVQHVALAHRLDGRVMLRRNSGGQLAAPSPLIGTSTPHPTMQPSDLALDPDGLLVVALRQESSLQVWERSGTTWTARPMVSLPFRPAELWPGPGSTGGLAIAAHRRSVVMLVTRTQPGAEPVVWPLYLGLGPTRIGSAEGLLVVADPAVNHLLLYR